MKHETLRHLRGDLKWTQVQLADRLGVPHDTYRCWESGRRPIPGEVAAQLSSLVGEERDDHPVTLPELARELGIHTRTLRAAAKDGRLTVSYGTRTYHGHPVCLATRAAGHAFRHIFYRKTTHWMARPPRPRPLPVVPVNYDLHLIGLRARLHLTQEQLARAIGAASKAVVYQWESRRRKPSAALWQRVEALRVTPVPDAL